MPPQKALLPLCGGRTGADGIPCHCNDLPAILISAHDAQLMLRGHACIDRSLHTNGLQLAVAEPIQLTARQNDIAGTPDADPCRNGLCSLWIVAGDHDRLHPGMAAAPLLLGFLGGYPVEGGILWCVTELATKETLDRAAAIVKEAL